MPFGWQAILRSIFQGPALPRGPPSILCGPAFPRGPSRGGAFPLRPLSQRVERVLRNCLLGRAAVAHLETEAVAVRQARPTDDRARVVR